MFRDVSFHSKPVTDVKWNCDGQYLGSGSSDRTAKIGQLDQSGNLKLLQTGIA